MRTTGIQRETGGNELEEIKGWNKNKEKETEQDERRRKRRVNCEDGIYSDSKDTEQEKTEGRRR